VGAHGSTKSSDRAGLLVTEFLIVSELV